jgi:hypothetical protein
VNKIVSVGSSNPSPSLVMSHLQVHHLAKHQHCISVMKGKSSSNQSHSTKYLTTKSDVKGAVPKIIPPWACGMQ